MANAKKIPENIIAEVVAQERATDAKKARDLEQIQREHAKKYRSLPRMDVQISPMYQPYFGRNCTVMINGITVSVPCDGTRYKVPSNYAAEIQRRIEEVDKRLLREKQMANNNVFEHSPGDIDIFQS